MSFDVEHAVVLDYLITIVCEIKSEFLFLSAILNFCTIYNVNSVRDVLLNVEMWTY